MATFRFDSWTGRGILLLIGAVFLITGLAGFYRERRFANEAREGRGTIVGKEVRQSHNRRRGTGSSVRTPHYETTYRFAVDGRTYGGRDELTQEEWRRLEKGQSVAILYLPDDPSTNRLSRPRSSTMNAMFGALGLALCAVAGVGALRSLRYTARLPVD
jgi:hypothetical protein